MANVLDLRRRIRSVKNTRQITKAMKVVSAAKLRRAQDRVIAARPYAQIIQRMLANVAQAAAEQNAADEIELLARRPEKRILLLVITADRGGTINGLIAALNQIIEILQPKQNEEGGTLVIPGHGHICDRHDVVNYRDMVTIIRGRIQYYVEQGMTLQQVKAAKPTLDYDGLYGATTGPWTSDMFVEAVYRELSKKKAEDRQKAAGGKQ